MRPGPALLLCTVLCAPGVEGAFAVDVHDRDHVELAWRPARGDVSAYVVFVSRNGGPYRSEQYTRAPRARVEGNAGETIQVRVRAYGVSGGATLESAVSEPSEPIRFLAARAAAPALGVAPPAKAAPLAASAPARAAPLAGEPERIPGFRFAPPLRIETHGDFDGDGDLDLLATLGSWRHPMALFQEDGSLEHAVVLAALSDTRSALAADFDGDGRDELALNSGSQLRLLSVGRGGQLNEIRRERIPPQARILAADLDGDGRATLVVYEPASGRLREWLAERNVDFGSIRPLHAVHAGDFDGDGRDDLWIQASAGASAELWLMNERGGFAVRQLRLGRSLGVSTVADVNGDGRADLAGYDAATDEIRAFLLDGTRVIGERRLGRGPVESLHGGDVDGDGLDDLLVRAPDGEASALLLSR